MTLNQLLGNPMKQTLQILLALVLINTSIFALANSNNIEKALAHKDRTQQDKARDEFRKPAEILALLDIRPDSKVVDFIAGRGYYTDLIARVLDNKGHLYSVKGKLEKRDLTAYKNISVLKEVDLSEIKQPVDRIFTALNYHDIVNKKEIDRSKLLKSLYNKLDDDGYLVVIDHNAAPGKGASDTKKKHRVENTFVLNEIQQAGFVLDRSLSVLANPNDNFELDVWQQSTKGKTDRFVYRFKKTK